MKPTTSEARGLVGAVRINHAADFDFTTTGFRVAALTGDDAHWMAADLRIGAHQSFAILGLEFLQAVAVDEKLKQFAHIARGRALRIPPLVE
jgi:hypothetical protein